MSKSKAQDNPRTNLKKFFEMDMEYSKAFAKARKTAVIPADYRKTFFENLTSLAETAGPMFRYLSMIRFHDKRDEIAWYDPVTKFIHIPSWWMDKQAFKNISSKEDMSFVTMHEILHHFLAHASLTKEFGDLPHIMVNIGADIVINNMLLTLFEGSRYNAASSLNIHNMLYFKREWYDMNEAQILALFRNYIPIFQTAENYVREKGADVIEKMEQDHAERFQEEIAHAVHSGIQQHQQQEVQDQIQDELNREAAQQNQTGQSQPGQQGQPQPGQQGQGTPQPGQSQPGQPQEGQQGQGTPQPGQPGAGQPGNFADLSESVGQGDSEAVGNKSTMAERARQPELSQRLHDGVQERMQQQGQDFHKGPDRADAVDQAIQDFMDGKRQGDALDQALEDLTQGLDPRDTPGHDLQDVSREFQQGFKDAVEQQGQSDMLQEFEGKFGELNLGDYMVNRKLFGERPREVIGDVSKRLPKHFDAGKFLEEMTENHPRLKGTMSSNAFMKTMFKRTRTISLVAKVKSLLSPSGAISRGMLDKRQDVHDGVIMPSLVTKSGKIAVLVDTSGSQSNEDVMDGLNTAFKSVMSGHEVTLIFNDAERYNHTRIRTSGQLKSFLKSRGFVRWGGSVFVSVFEEFILKKRFDKVIFVTDLYIEAAKLPRGYAKDVIVLYTHHESAVAPFIRANPTWKDAQFFPVTLKRTVTL